MVWRNEDLVAEKLGALSGIRRLTTLADIEAFAFVGHTDCAGHQVSDDDHAQHVREAAELLKRELEVEQPVYAILAVRGMSDEVWDLQLLATF
jgi:hypothetical protein